MALRILVVDDFEPFRRFLCSTLKQGPELQVVGEVSDGLEAVEKASELQPDLVLLDVGLPKLNGLEAARRIRKLASLTKILFVSQDFSFDMVEAAIRAGGFGYIHKPRAGKELLPGIEAISQSRYFVSGMLTGKDHDHEMDRPRVAHEVQFYSDDQVLIESFADFIATQLRADKSTIMIATELHRSGILQRLNAGGLDVSQAVKAGTLIPLDAADTLSGFMRNGVPDPNPFFDLMEELIATAGRAAPRREAPRVAVCGEIAPLLLAQGKSILAIQVEQLWHLLAQRMRLDTLCAYTLRGMDEDTLESISDEHSAVYSR